jgi:AcrR family transcriptional regulator
MTNHEFDMNEEADIQTEAPTSSPKKRKRTKKAIETQGRILHTALELFRDKGFEKTSMRDIAEAAGVAVGASYYYFRTKEELVLAYYEDACSKDSEYVDHIVEKTTSFAERFTSFMRYKLDQLSANRGFMNILARSAANPEDPLSPFNDNTKHIREEAIDWMTTMIEGSDVKVSAKLRPYLPGVLWFYMMGVIFFWLHDRTENQKASDTLLHLSARLVMQLFWLSSLPLTGKINEMVAKLFDVILESQNGSSPQDSDATVTSDTSEAETHADVMQ